MKAEISLTVDLLEITNCPKAIELTPLQTAAFLAATSITTGDLPPVTPETHSPDPLHPEIT